MSSVLGGFRVLANYEREHLFSWVGHTEVQFLFAVSHTGLVDGFLLITFLLKIIGYFLITSDFFFQTLW